MLQDHLEESIITEEVLRDWPTYYGQVFQQTRHTREQIQVLERRKSTEKYNTRSNRTGDSQTAKTQNTSTPVCAVSTTKLGETRYHLPANEKTTGNCRIKRPIHGT